MEPGQLNISSAVPEEINPVPSQKQQATGTAFCCLTDFEVKSNLY
jgi:hypothetical protein